MEVGKSKIIVNSRDSGEDMRVLGGLCSPNTLYLLHYHGDFPKESKSSNLHEAVQLTREAYLAGRDRPFVYIPAISSTTRRLLTLRVYFAVVGHDMAKEHVYPTLLAQCTLWGATRYFVIALIFLL